MRIISNVIFIGLIIIVPIFIFIGLIKFVGQQNNTIIDLNTESTECQRYNPFVAAALKVAMNDYDIDIFNCWNGFSLGLANSLNELDIQNIILINHDRSHAVVAVLIEATEGGFVSTDPTFEILEIRNSDKEVICTCK